MLYVMTLFLITILGINSPKFHTTIPEGVRIGSLTLRDGDLVQVDVPAVNDEGLILQLESSGKTLRIPVPTADFQDGHHFERPADGILNVSLRGQIRERVERVEQRGCGKPSFWYILVANYPVFARYVNADAECAKAITESKVQLRLDFAGLGYVESPVKTIER